MSKNNTNVGPGTILTCTLVAALAAAGTAQASVGDGPRAYQVAPVGTQMFNFIPMFEDSTFNIDGSPTDPAARIDANVLAMQYTNVMQVKGMLTGLFVIVPVASVEGDLIDVPRQSKSSGVGDIQVGAVVGLIGSPAMDPQQYATFEPGFSFGLMGKISMPVGEYDVDKVVNLGTNRWAAQIAPILTWNYGGSLLPGKVTTLEIVPSVWVYGDNTDPSGGGDRMEQEPLYSVEMHFTHDFNDRFWGSLDALYSKGGATTTDGVQTGEGTDLGGLGVSFGFYLPGGKSLQFGYGETVKSDIDGLDDSILRLKFGMTF